MPEAKAFDPASLEHGIEFPLAGGSMDPWLKRGARLLVDVSRTDPAPGEVVCLRKPDHWLIHRVLLRCPRREETLYVQRGETNFRPMWFTRCEVFGVVVAFRFPDRDEVPFCPVPTRAIALWERLAARAYLMAFLAKKSLMGKGKG